MQLPGDVTRALVRLRGEDQSRLAEMLPLVYGDLRRLAESYFRRERQDHTLQPTALVHEAYLRLMNGRDPPIGSREHFFRAAAVVMRHILVNHARDRQRLKRGGGGEREALDDALVAFEERAVDLVALDEALERLAELDRRQTQIVELRFFGGLSMPEVAEALDCPLRTVESEWALAKAWLLREVNRA